MLNQFGIAPAVSDLAMLDGKVIDQYADNLAVDHATLRLCKNAPVFNKDTVLADVTECDFTGYAPVDLIPANWMAGMEMPDGSLVALYNALATFTQTAPTVTNSVFGWFAVNADQDTLLDGGLFDLGLAFDQAGRSISLEYALTLKADAGGSAVDATTNAVPA